jgi:Fe2+ transport system protein FeoA
VELEAEGLEIRWEGLRRTKSGGAADLTIQVGNASVKYNVYLGEKAIVLEFESTDRSHAELAARLLRLAGVSAEVKRKEGGREVWRVRAYTDVLAAGHEKLRKTLAEIVREAATRGWIDAGRAERWLEKLEGGVALIEGWPRYEVGLAKGALVVRFSSTNPDNIEREAQRLKKMGLIEGKHFTVKMPKDGKKGYVYIRREGLEHAAWLSVHGSEEQQRRLAAEFVEYILQRAKEEGEEVYEKVKKIVEGGMSRAS